MQNELEALTHRVDELAKSVETLQALLRAMTRESTPKGKAA